MLSIKVRLDLSGEILLALLKALSALALVLVAA